MKGDDDNFVVITIGTDFCFSRVSLLSVVPRST